MSTKDGRFARQLARRHRRERVAGAAVVILGVAVLVVAIIALRHPNHSSSGAPVSTSTSTSSLPPSTVTESSSPPSSSSSTSTSASSPPPSSSSSGPQPPAGAKPLVVVNDTSTPRLAHRAARRFERGGWTVTKVDESFSNNIASTVAYFDPNVHGARHAAKLLMKQFPAILRTAPRFTPAPGGDALPDGPVVVVLTSDYSP